jgi:hypothetical protein
VRLVAEARTLEAARALCEEAGMALQGQAVPAGR